VLTDILGAVKLHKKGEVVEPAGGETGVPHCLAEARKLQRSFISLF
jgi:hypothetical protein